MRLSSSDMRKGLLLFWLVLLAGFSPFAVAQSVVASPASCANVNGSGTQSWSNAAQAESSDNNYATASLNDTQVSESLQCSNYGFNIPANATITGVTVSVERKASASSRLQDASVQLIKSGVVQTTNRATSTYYTTSDTYEDHGGSTDLWGTSWTPADINNSNFGVAFAAQKSGTSGGAYTASVDHVQVQIDYTIPFACTPPSNTPAGLSLTCVCDTFERTTLNPSTIFGGNWIVSTSDSTGIVPSIVNPGYLRLTNNTGNNAKAATVPGIFPAAGNYISVEFQQYAYNGSGADGIAVTLSDYSVPAVPGAYGGSLGYAQKTGINGFAGGWIGVALDEYGNYQNPTEGRIGGPGFVPESVGVRGSGSGASGYVWLGGTSGLAPLIDNRSSTSPSLGYYYQVIVDARNEPTSTSISVNRDTGSGYQSLITIPNVYSAAIAQGATQSPVPANWQISFTGSTGGSTNIHEIGGLRICAESVWPPSGGTASGFNAIDEGYGAPPLAVQNYLNGHIYMKIMGQPFKLNVAALSDNQLQTAYVVSGSKTVTLKLVDNSDSACVLDNTQANYCNSTCTSKSAVPGGSQTLTFTSSDKGQKQSGSFTLNSAYKNLVAIISDGTVTACSTDAFSVRPTGIASVVSSNATNTTTSGTPVFKAGSTPFSLTATVSGVSGNPNGYTGVLKINNNAVIPVTPATVAGMLSGTFPAAISATPLATAAGNGFTYSEVGGFQLPGYDPATDTATYRGVYDGVATASECTAVGLTTAQCNTLRAATWTGVDSISTKGDCVLDSYANTKDASGKYGCNFGNTSATGVFGRFVPDHLVVSGATLQNRSELSCASAPTFTYMGEPMLLAMTLTAQNAVNATTVNYAGALVKLDLSSAAMLGLGAFNNLNDPALNTPLSSRLAGGVPTGSWSSGVVSVAVPVTLQRLTAAPYVDGPYDSLDVGVVPQDADGVTLLSSVLNRDMDNDASHVNDHQYVASTKVRFGRLWLGNAYGSDKLALTVPYEIQYWNGNAFVKNTADNCTALKAANFGLGNYQGAVSSSNLPATAIVPGSFSAGAGSVTLAAPSASGSADLVARLSTATSMCPGWSPTYPAGSPLSADYLLGKWCGSTFSKDPVARTTFGIFGSSAKKGPIYLRESF